jgi:signal peptidase I
MSSWAAAAIALAACVLAVLLARRRFLVVTVVGGTCWPPTLLPGDRVLVRRHRRAPVGVGDVLVFHEPDGQRAIKRVAAVAGDAVPDTVRPVTGGTDVVPPGMLVLLGDGIRSGDSRQWGFIPANRTLGVMTRKLSASTLMHE